MYYRFKFGRRNSRHFRLSIFIVFLYIQEKHQNTVRTCVDQVNTGSMEVTFFFFLRIRLTTNRSKRTTEEIKDDKAWRTATNKLDLIYANYSVMY